MNFSASRNLTNHQKYGGKNSIHECSLKPLEKMEKKIKHPVVIAVVDYVKLSENA